MAWAKKQPAPKPQKDRRGMVSAKAARQQAERARSKAAFKAARKGK